jgi:hypothetical protein
MLYWVAYLEVGPCLVGGPGGRPACPPPGPGLDADVGLDKEGAGRGIGSVGY